MKWKKNQKSVDVPLKQIKPNIKNPRKGQYDKVDLEELKASLESLGQITNVKIDEEGNILGGHRRYKAATELGWKTLRCDIIVGLSQFAKSAILISDNATQRQFNAWESRKAICDIYWNEFCEEYEFKGTQDKGYTEFAKRLGVSKATVRHVIDSTNKQNQTIIRKFEREGMSTDVLDTVLKSPAKYREQLAQKAISIKNKPNQTIREGIRMYKKKLAADSMKQIEHPAFFATIHSKLNAIGMIMTKSVVKKMTPNERMKMKKAIEKHILPAYKAIKEKK